MLLRSETVSASTSSTPARPQMTRIGSISSSNPTKTILHAVSGHAAPGQVLACLGPSGAGKTSVLSVLSGRSTYQEGTIRINDKVLTKRELKKLQAIRLQQLDLQ
jgi:ABC-type multidrug transport system ATPase subunit